jgi:hypothetical protein
MDGSANSWVRPAAADIPTHRFIDVLIRRLGIFCQQDSGTHDLP